MKEKTKQSVLMSLRFEFDTPHITPDRAIEIMNTTKEIDRDYYLEMYSDLLTDGIISE